MIVVVHEMNVCPFAMRSIKRMVADHCQSFFREMILDDMVKIFVVPPRHVNVIKAAARFIDTALRLVLGDVEVRVLGEELWKDNLI